MLDDLAATIRASPRPWRRGGRSADELPVRAFAGAVVGAGIAVWLTAADAPLSPGYQGVADYMEQFDAAWPGSTTAACGSDLG